MPAGDPDDQATVDRFNAYFVAMADCTSGARAAACTVVGRRQLQGDAEDVRDDLHDERALAWDTADRDRAGDVRVPGGPVVQRPMRLHVGEPPSLRALLARPGTRLTPHHS